jgi:mannose/cellobiose epimerase-like protein (N-acyl-D-glucosamine 2-epimerase family)
MLAAVSPLAPVRADAQDGKGAELAALSASAEQELKGDILPFWMKYTRNTENGGYYGLIRADMTVRQGAMRGALLTSRVLWTFSAAYRTTTRRTLRWRHGPTGT